MKKLNLTSGLLFAALGIVVFVFSVNIQTANASFPGANGKITFTSDRDGNYEIYTMNPDGSGVVRLTTNNESDGGPVWSPDGTKIAFYRLDSVHNIGDIYVMSASGGNQVNITNNTSNWDDGYPAWSPDGTKIAFVSNRSHSYEIYSMNSDGSNVQQLTNNPTFGNTEPVWSPDGTKIAFVSNRSGAGLEIYTMNANGSNILRLTNAPTSLSMDPAWSPDGTKIAFMSNRSNSYEIYSMNSDGSNVQRLTNTPSHLNQQPAWSPDGTKIVYDSNLSFRPMDVYVMNADGSNPVDIASTAGWDGDPDWQPIPSLPNQPPTLSNLLQWDGSTVISEGYIVRYPSIAFSVNVSDPNGDQVKLQVELRRLEEPFTGNDDGGILTSDFVPSGWTNLRITRTGLSDGKYHWRARAVDSSSNKSEWQEFGAVGNVDFEILTCQTSSSGLNTCNLQKGDILLLHSNNLLFFAEATLFSGYWTHVGIYNGDGTITESYPDFPADTPGVVTTPVVQSLFWNKDVTDWAVLRVGSDTTKQSNAVNYAENQEGKHYNYFFSDKETELKFYCSQLVWRAYQTQGVDLDSNLSLFGAATKWLTPTGLLTGIALANAVPPDDIYFSSNASVIEQRPGTLTGIGRWVLRLLSPGTLLVTDPQGRRIGIDPVTNTNLQEIPGASYSGPDTEPQTIAIEQLIEGSWTIQVVGTGSGDYTLQAESIDRDFHTVITDPGTISTSTIATYQLLNLGDGSQPILTQIVSIDVKPGTNPNPLNLKSKGVIPVAILTTDSFDATTVAPLSVKFASSGATSTQSSIEDVNGDGRLDLILHFPTQQTGIKNSDTQACLTGETNSGVNIQGCDIIRIVGN